GDGCLRDGLLRAARADPADRPPADLRPAPLPLLSGWPWLPRWWPPGLDVGRLNMSHGSQASHHAAYRNVRAAGDASGHSVDVLGDLQGPKIRLGRFAETFVVPEVAPTDDMVPQVARPCRTSAAAIRGIWWCWWPAARHPRPHQRAARPPHRRRDRDVRAGVRTIRT